MSVVAELKPETAADVIGGTLDESASVVVQPYVNPLTGESVELRHAFKAGDWWDGHRVIPAAEHAERVTEAGWLDQARKALTANQTYLDLTTPTQAQVVAQVAALTRQTMALERLAVKRWS